MRVLADVIGQNEAIARVLERQATPRKECFVISGSCGSGVSWTLSQIGAAWEGRGGIALKATGVAVNPPRKLLPWLTIASPANNALARWEVLKGGASRASKALPVVGDAASYLVDEVLNFRQKNVARHTQMLGEKEHDLLYVIETASRGKRLLLAIDQLASWDDESWGLLEIILSPLLHDFYPCLANVLVIAGVNEEIPARGRAMLEKIPQFETKLARLSRADLPAALDAFQFPALSGPEMDLLYEATGGRLDLLCDFGALSGDVGAHGLAGERNAIYERLIERRLRTLKGNVAALEGLLTAGAFIGNSFSLEEASCMTGFARDEIQLLLRQAEEERLLGIRGAFVSFPSAAMQRYFRGAKIADPARHHAKFAECLRRMRPGDYEARAQHHFLAGEIDPALVCHCLAALDAQRRRGRAPEAGALQEAEGWSEYLSYLAAMRAAYAAHDRDALTDGLAILESIEAFLPEPLIAERDYLEGQMRMKSHRVADIERAATVLRRWTGFQDKEPEIWSRIAQTLMVAWSETNRYDEAVELEEALTKYYGARRTLDPWALFGLNCLRRRSECLHHLVPARNRLESALAYFGPAPGAALPRHPLQYYYTLSNLVANLIANGAFAAATVRGAELERLVQHHPNYEWPGLEVAANNSILAAYLAKTLPLPEAVELLRKIDDHRTEIGDRLLIENNLAVLLALAGRADDAGNILEGAMKRLGEKAESDGFHRYFVANNLAGVLALRGEIDRALQIFEAGRDDLPRFYPAIRETLVRRHALMLEALRAASGLSAEKYDSFLRDRHPPQLGPHWEFYGRGFLLTDIQFWTSD